MKHDKPYDKSVYRALVLVTQIGIHLLVPICLMTLLGWYLDEKLDTVFITVILFVMGAIAGGQNAYKLVMQSMKEEVSLEEGLSGDKPQMNKPKKTSGWVQSDVQEVEGAERPDGSME
ncbi:MAG: AtpZ/AtpI family protein [Lachnospiraceae bacterium]|nr:AtpZ/AtpI family protein [Lachnospiraceae bacterium]